MAKKKKKRDRLKNVAKKDREQTVDDADAALAQALGQGQYSGREHNTVEQTQAFQSWNYLAIAPICRLVARSHTEIYDEREMTAEQKSLRAHLRNRHGSEFKAFTHNQDVGEPAPHDFRWWRLIDRPNPWQRGRLFRWDVVQQMRLHGMCLVWNVPNQLDKTFWRIVLPMSVVTAIPPGSREQFPMGGVRVQSLQWIGHFFPKATVHGSHVHYAANRDIPMEQLTKYAYPHPLLRGDGFSPTDASKDWGTAIDSVHKAAIRQFGKEGSHKKVAWTPADDNVINNATKLDDYQMRMDQRIRNSDNQVVVMPKGTVHDLSIDPDSMGYDALETGYGRLMLATHGTSETAASLIAHQTYGGNAAAMSSFSTNTVQSDLDIMADSDTATMQEEEGEGRTIEYTAPTFDDPELTETQNQNDLDSASILVDEWRTRRGLEPFGGERGKLTAGSEAAKNWGAPQPQAGPGMPGMPGQPSGLMRFRDDRVNQRPVQVQGFDIPKLESNDQKSLIGKNVDTSIEGPPVFAFELDGMLAEFSGPYDPDVIGIPMQSNVEVLKLCKAAGLGVIIYTARDNDRIVADWLDKHEIPWDAINENPWAPETNAKVMVQAYIGDRAVSARQTEGVVMTEILTRLEDKPEWHASVMQQLKRRHFDRRYQFFCIPIGGELGEYLQSLQATIDDNDLADEGLESELHITVLYGVVGADSWEVSQRLSALSRPEFRLRKKPTVFPNHDPAAQSRALVVELDGDDLHAIHANVSGQFSHISTYPTYRPHITLAYIKPEAAEKYERMDVRKYAAAGERLIFRTPETSDLVIPLR